jgi:DNA polymerase III delta prime subunit
MNTTNSSGHNVGNMFSTQQLMIMMLPTLIQTITGLLTGIITMVLSGAGIGFFINFIIGFLKIKTSKQPVELSITQSTRMLRDGLVTDGDHSFNSNLILGVLETLSKLNLPIETADVNLRSSSSTDVTKPGVKNENEHMKKYTIHLIPRNSYQYNGMTIKYEKSETSQSSNKDDKSSVFGLTYVLKITSYTKTFQELQNFVMQCYYDWVDVHYPSEGKIPRKLFYQVKSNYAYPVFKKFNYGVCDSDNAFEGIFVPKYYLQKINTLIRKVNSGDIPKLIILFTGRPGCGKTTLQRAILESLDRHCIVQKLAHTGNDQELMDIYFSDIITTTSGEACNIPLDERVYLLEDVDAESKLLHCRKKDIAADCSEATEAKIDTTAAANLAMVNPYAAMMAAYAGGGIQKQSTGEKLTMSGYLNAIDGIMRLKKAVILVSTNHPEILDEAVTRHGRITLKIDLREMKREDVHDMIRYHYNGETIRDELVKDDLIVPCDLEALCQNCESIAELEEGVVNLCASYKSNLNVQ